MNEVGEVCGHLEVARTPRSDWTFSTMSESHITPTTTCPGEVDAACGVLPPHTPPFADTPQPLPSPLMDSPPVPLIPTSPHPMQYLPHRRTKLLQCEHWERHRLPSKAE